MEDNMWRSVPAVLAAAWVTFEVVRQLTARRLAGKGAGLAMRFLAWALRPWGCWAFFNLAFRLRWGDGFNNRRTFPFFANLWDDTESIAAATARLLRMPGVWIWGAAVVVIGGAVVFLVVRTAHRETVPARAEMVMTVACCVALAIALHLAMACLPGGMGKRETGRGSLVSAWHAHATMLYAVPLVRSGRHYLEHFAELQPRLRATIHGLSHPPLASLSMYWVGKLSGAAGRDIRARGTRVRYAVGLTVVESLNVVLVCLLGVALFGCGRTGLIAAALWLASPAVITYSTFAQNGLYAVAFNLTLLLIWVNASSLRWRPAVSVALGVVFGGLTLLCYSWSIPAAMHAALVCVLGWRRRWSFRELCLRGGVPMAVMVVVAAAIFLRFGLNYVAIYLASRAYVDQWYPFTGLYQQFMALIGGQFDILLMMGSVACSAFLVAAGVRVRTLRRLDDNACFLLVILALYLIPVLFGPNCLKMETARCWNWVASVPLVFAARMLLAMPRPSMWSGGAVAVSVVTCLLMRLFLNFAP